MNNYIIEGNVKKGINLSIGVFSYIKGPVVFGNNVEIGSHCVIGHIPQDYRYKGEETYIVIEDNVVLSSHVIVSRATGIENKTVVGKGSRVMSFVHISHNMFIGEGVIIISGSMFGGETQIGNYAYIGGKTATHQFVRVGSYAFTGAMSYLSQDLPPFLAGTGSPFYIYGVNTLGLLRHGFNKEQINRIKHYYELYKRGIDLMLKEVETWVNEMPFFTSVLDFFSVSSKRGYRRKFL